MRLYEILMVSNFIHFKRCTIRHFAHMYTEQLDKWEAPPLNQVSKELEKIQKLMKQQEDASNEFRLAMHL